MNKKTEIIYLYSIDSSPLGQIWLAASDTGLISVEFKLDIEQYSQALKKRFPKAEIWLCADFGSPAEQILELAAHELSAYLAGECMSFSFPIDWRGMKPFQRAALVETAAIPYGEVLTYAEIARRVGKPNAQRAVGRAEATNPMPLVIPCHRVIGSDGKLHGYGGPGGIATKQMLIDMEKSRR